MEGITLVHLISASATLILMIGLGICSGRKVSGAADFDTGGGRAGAIMVAGTIIGTLVGGSSTIGTAELAFQLRLFRLVVHPGRRHRLPDPGGLLRQFPSGTAAAPLSSS
ncbi:MAG: hypothetical protein ACLU38_07580 [Dysosmobacter sp.]